MVKSHRVILITAVHVAVIAAATVWSAAVPAALLASLLWIRSRR